MNYLHKPHMTSAVKHTVDHMPHVHVSLRRLLVMMMLSMVAVVVSAQASETPADSAGVTSTEEMGAQAITSYRDFFASDPSTTGYWRFDESAGATSLPTAGSAVFNGTYKWSPTLGQGGAINGDANTSVLLKRASSQYVDFGSRPNPADTSYAYVIWLKPTSLTWNTWIAGPGISLYNDTNNGKITFCRETGCSGSSATALKVGVWTMVVAGYDAAASKRWLYVNGVPGKIGGWDDTTVIAPGTELTRVGTGLSSANRANWYFNGGVDEFAMMSRMPSSAEVTSLFNLASGGAGATTSILTGGEAPSTSSSVGFTFQGTVPTNATVTTVGQCRVDGGAWADCSSPYTATGLTDGDHVFEVRAANPWGSYTGVTSASKTFTVDLSAPNTIISSAPPALTASTSATVAFNANKSGQTFRCSLDGATASSCASPLSLTGLGQGAHTLSVTAVNSQGVVDPTPATASWTVDSVAPQVGGLTGPVDGPSTSASLAFTVDDATASLSCRLDGGSWSSCTSPWSLTGLAEMSHTVTVRATDAAGNASQRDWTWLIDHTAPALTVTGAPSGLRTTDTASIGFTTSDGVVECSIDGGAWTTCSGSSLDLSDLTEGAHTVSLRARDSLDNVSAVQTASWTVDTVAPQILDLAGPASTRDTSATVSFNRDDASATIQCRLDGGAWSTCTSPVTLTDVAEGSHTLTVRLRDAAGNTSQRDWTWMVDRTPPVVTIDSSDVEDATTSTTFTLPVSIASGVTLQCSLDGGSWATCATPVTLNDLDEGEHVLRVRGRDTLGNTSAVQSTIWTVDSTPPALDVDLPRSRADGTLLLSGDAGTAGGDSASIALRLTGNGLSMDLTTLRSGGRWSTGTLAALDPGSYRLDATQRDAAGNVARASITFTVAPRVVPVATQRPEEGTRVTDVTDPQATQTITTGTPTSAIPTVGTAGAAPARPTTAAPTSSAPVCLSRRVITVHTRSNLKRIRATLRGKSLRVRHLSGHRYQVIVDLRGQRRGTYTVKMRLVTRGGKVSHITRTYRTCVTR